MMSFISFPSLPVTERLVTCGPISDQTTNRPVRDSSTALPRILFDALKHLENPFPANRTRPNQRQSGGTAHEAAGGHVRRKINQHRPSNDLTLLHPSPITAIERIVPIVTQDEKLAWWNHQFATTALAQQIAPLGRHNRRQHLGPLWKVIPKLVWELRLVNRVRLILKRPIDEQPLVFKLQTIAAGSHHALHKRLIGINRIAKHDQVPTHGSFHREFLDKNTISHQERILHGSGGHGERLESEREHEDNNAEHHPRRR